MTVHFIFFHFNLPCFIFVAIKCKNTYENEAYFLFMDILHFVNGVYPKGGC